VVLERCTAGVHARIVPTGMGGGAARRGRATGQRTGRTQSGAARRRAIERLLAAMGATLDGATRALERHAAANRASRAQVIADELADHVSALREYHRQLRELLAADADASVEHGDP
jgi:hypothetical protein